MRKAIVILVVVLIFIAVPLITVWAQFGRAETITGKVANVASKIAFGGPLLIIAGLVSVYVNLLGLLSLQMIHLFLKLASFNDFINFDPVVIGWTIVRDVVNMSFVVILLLIAISTILNIEAYSYRRLLPRLVLMAVLINFSRTIAGLLIDAGQVVMLTFVNAFSAAAGGNFVSALHINDLLAIGLDGIFSTDVTIPTILGSYILAAVAITVTFMVMLVFVGVLIFRVLALWFLIVLSPLAFALGAWPSGSVSKYYGQWWDEFTKNIICPTVLSFFLWLALMMMSANYIGVLAPNLNGTGDKMAPPPAGSIELSAPETFASFLIGIGFLIMALKMTQSLCGSIAGFAPKMLDFAKKQGVAAAKFAGKGAMLATVAGANEAARGYDQARGREFQGTIQERGYKALTNLPLVRNWAYDKLGKARAEHAKSMGSQSEIMSKLSLEEQDRMLARRPAIVTSDTAAARAGQVFFGVTDAKRERAKEAQYKKELEPQYSAKEAQYRKELEPQYGKEEAAKKAKKMVDEEVSIKAKEMVRTEKAGQVKEFIEMSKAAATPEITRKLIEMKNTRPDLLEGSEFVEHVDYMEPEDIKKLTPAAFEGVIDKPEMSSDTRERFLEAGEKGSVGLARLVKEIREADAKEAKAKGGEVQEKYWKQEEVTFVTKKVESQLREQDIGEDDVANPYIAERLATDTNYSALLAAILRGDSKRTAVLQKTLDTLRKNLITKPGGGIVERDGKKVYSPEMLALAESVVRTGGKISEVYRINEDTAEFADVTDRDSYIESLQGDNKIDIILKTEGDVLRVENYENDVARSVVNAISVEDLGKLVSKTGKDSAAKQTLADIIKALRHFEKTNTNAAKLLKKIRKNPFMYEKVYKQASDKKGQGGSGSSSAPPNAEEPEDEAGASDEDE